MTNTKSTICSTCGSTNIEEFKETKPIKVPYGSEEKVELVFNRCLDCKTEGDFQEKNDELFLQTEKKSMQSSLESIFDFFSQSGLSLAYIERALELPQRTMTRWKAGELSASSIALLRILRTYPWVLEVAEHQYDPIIANTVYIKNALNDFLKDFQIFASAKNISFDNLKFQKAGIWSEHPNFFVYAWFNQDKVPFKKMAQTENEIEINPSPNALNIGLNQPMEVQVAGS
jgi:hypothetical protein